MDNTEVLAGIAKAMAPPAFLGLPLGDWGVILAIIAALFNIITTGPAAIRMIRGWFNKEK